MITQMIKSMGMLLLDVCFVIIIMFCVDNIWDTYNGRNELDYEFVSAMEFSGEKADVLQGEAPPAIHGYIPMSNSDTPDMWFYEVRNQEEWDYYCSLIGIDAKQNALDFSKGYYVFSVSRELTNLYLETDVWWDVKEYGNLVRADFNLDTYEEHTIFVYHLDEKIDFYFNQRDYEVGNYNMTKGEQNSLADEPDKPYLTGPYPETRVD